MALAHGAGNRRTGVQSSPDQYGGMGRKERALFDEKTARIRPTAELSKRAKFTREDVLKFDVEMPSRRRQSSPCQRSDGQDRRMGRRELGGIEVRGMHVDFHENNDLQRSKQHAGLQAAEIQIHDGSGELGV